MRAVLGDRKLAPERAGLQREIAGVRGPLPSKLVGRLLGSYGIRGQIRNGAFGCGAVASAGQIGYPMVVKVMSADVPHRSDVGAVQLGIKDETGLRAAVALIRKEYAGQGSGCRHRRLRDAGRADRLQQAMVGYQAAPPMRADDSRSAASWSSSRRTRR